MALITALLVDMNGLFRHWHNSGARKTENLAGLPDGTIARYAYDHPTYRLARVGLLTDQQWADDVANRLAKDFGPHVREHLPHWRNDRGTPSLDMVTLLAEIRTHIPIGVLSNSTDALHDDLRHHGITFDHVFPSADLGVDKPSPHAFKLAVQQMGHTPDTMVYFDDEPTFVTAASSIGLTAHPFTNPDQFASTLIQAGLPLTASH
ncbi:HAD-IA family hydrolase [Streptomyces sp. NPDC093111]|uniref:HAD-IA family hydrolase n=1 Tax=Streptomyces sp. NPDC093111 TaxID=3154978 RepID=UPI003428FD9B